MASMPTMESVSTTRPAGVALDSGFRPAPLLAIAAVILLFGWRFFFLIWKDSVNVLFWDQWDFLEPFFHGDPGFAKLFFLQWGPHREGVGLIADKFLYPLTHWNVRAESFMIGGCIFAAMALALMLKRKLFGRMSYSDIAIPIMFLTLAQSATVLHTPNPAYSGFPLLMIMLYCLALLHRNRVVRYGSVLLLNFLLIYTGFGLFIGGVTIGIFALECYCRLRRMTSTPFALPLAALLVATASLGSFFIHYPFRPAVDCFAVTPRYVVSYPWFMAEMFAAFVGPKRYIPVLTVPGVVILLAATAMLGTHLLCLLKCGRPTDTHLVGAALLGYSLMFSASAAVGRVCLGMQAAAAGNYATLLIPAFLAMYFYLLSRSWLSKRELVLGLFIAFLVPGAVRKAHGVDQFADAKRAWAACYVRTEDIRYCEQVASKSLLAGTLPDHFQIHPDPEGSGLRQKLDYLKQHRLNLFAETSSK
jgi:hypothetical protein